MRLFTQIALVYLISIPSGRAIADGPEDAGSVVARLKESLAAIRSAEGKYRTYFSPSAPGTENSIAVDGKAAPGAVNGPADLVLYSEFDWAWQASPYREAIDGRWGFVHEGRMQYTPAAFAFDGTVLRTHSRDGKAGLIKPIDHTFTNWRNPLRLIGIGIAYDPPRDLDALLEGAALVPGPESPGPLRVLRGEYRDQGQDYQLAAWLDPRCGHLPRRIEVFEKARRYVSERIVNEEFREAEPGVWMIARGSDTLHYVADFRLPEGMTPDQLEKLDAEKIRAVREKAEAIVGTLGMGTQTWIVDPEGLRLNRAIPRDRFVLDYPEGTRLFDTTHDPPLQYPRKAKRTDDEWKAIVEEGKQRARQDRERRAAWDALVGTKAPEFPEGSSWFDGRPRKLGDLLGMPLILDFWAEWCGPCRNVLPAVAQIHENREKLGFAIVGVHTPGSDREAIARVIEEFNLGCPILIDVPDGSGNRAWGDLFGRYALNAIPSAVLLDRDGRIARIGELAEVVEKARELADKH